MKTLQAAAVLLMLLFAAVQAPAADSAEENTAIQDGRAARMILVTFADSSINRVKSNAAGGSYQRRGYYRKSTWSTRIAEEISVTYRLKQVNEWPISELGVYCVVYEAGGDEPLETVLEILRRDKRIDSAQAMHMFRAMGGNVSYGDPYYRLQNNLQSMHIEAAHRLSTGRGVKLAVIDTGADLEHPDLTGQISTHQDFTAKDAAQFSSDIHGTAVAGIIGARAANSEGIVGVAPNAEISVLKACWQTESDSPSAVCNSLTLALALNTAIRMQPQIINMSLAGPQDPLLQQLLEHALAKGIIVVAAADQSRADSGFPACLPGVIAAYSSEATADNAFNAQPPAFSAPGSEILTTFPHAAYNFMSGSSIAAAQISGVIALLFELKSDLSTADISALLGNSAASSSAAGRAAIVPVNAEAAIAYLSDAKYAAAEKKFLFY